MLERRTFLKGALAGSVLCGPAAQHWPGAEGFAKDLFLDGDLGVASGDPDAQSVVLWTALPKSAWPPSGIGSTEVSYLVALRPDFARESIVTRGKVTTSHEIDHTVKVRVTGLKPYTTYYYRFESCCGRYLSVVGRTKTAPSPEDHTAAVRFAFVSCQDFTNGYYSAYHALAQEDLDFCVHLGDVIYETGTAEFQKNQIRIDPIGDPLDGNRATTLAEYRAKHRLSLSDPSWRAVRARFPWIMLWDDHDVENNYTGTNSTAAARALRNAGYRSFLEYMPVTAMPGAFEQPQMFRSLKYGRLLEGFALDERQYRDPPACKRDMVTFDCKALHASGRTMLGQVQRHWLKTELAHSQARWKVLFNEVMMMPLRLLALPPALAGIPQRIFGDTAGRIAPALYANLDAWDGFPAEREDLLGHIATRGIDNVLVMTGDIHATFAGECRTETGSTPKTVALEFATPSVTSTNLEQLIGKQRLALLRPFVNMSNPHFKFAEYTLHGYTHVSLTEDHATVSVRVVSTIEKPVALTSTLKSFRVFAGTSLLVPHL